MSAAPVETPDPYQPHRRILLDPSELRELSRLAPGRALGDAAFDWLRILAAWGAVAVWPEWWVVVLAIPVVGTARYAHQVLAHDGIHGRLLQDPDRNDLFTDLVLLGPVGAVVRLNGRHHLDHHRRLGQASDPDRFKYTSEDKRTRLALLGYLTGVTTVWRAARTVFGRDPQRAEERDGYRPRDLAILIGWQLALLAGLSAAIGWWAYPVLWLLPVYLFSYGGDMTRQFLEHAHPEPDAEANRHRLITHESSALERLFLAPHAMNFHGAHHLWPSIPYYRLAEADRRMRERNESPELLWRGSYAASLRYYARALPLSDSRDTLPT